MKYKICWITLCKDEMDILPFVSRYWEKIGCNVLVYDNGSVDGSLEYLSSLPYVEVRHFETTGQNDIIQKAIKEKAYLELRDKFNSLFVGSGIDVRKVNLCEENLEEFFTRFISNN